MDSIALALETGLICRAARLLALFDKHKHAHPPQLPHAYKAFFHCYESGGTLARQTTETNDAQYVYVDNLPVNA